MTTWRDRAAESAAARPCTRIGARAPTRPIPLFVRLADLPNVPYVVETSGDMTRIGRLVEEIDRHGSARYFTTLESLLINLTLGGSGAAMPPPAARIGSEVVRAFRAGDIQQAVEWQRMLGIFPGKWRRYGLLRS